MTITVEDHLQAYREKHGEEAWRAEVQRLAITALQTGSEKQESFWRARTKDFEWLDFEQLKAQAKASPPGMDRLIAETIKRELPGLKTQAQYDAVAGTMQALQLVVNAVMERDQTREQEARKALEQCLEAVRKATELTLKLEDVPEAAESSEAQAFKDAPRQFQEVEVHQMLRNELAMVNSIDKLNAWYEESREDRKKLVSQSLRNDLVDAIRARRKSLT